MGKSAAWFICVTASLLVAVVVCTSIQWVRYLGWSPTGRVGVSVRRTPPHASSLTAFLTFLPGYGRAHLSSLRLVFTFFQAGPFDVDDVDDDDFNVAISIVQHQALSLLIQCSFISVLSSRLFPFLIAFKVFNMRNGCWPTQRVQSSALAGSCTPTLGGRRVGLPSSAAQGRRLLSRLPGGTRQCDALQFGKERKSEAHVDLDLCAGAECVATKRSKLKVSSLAQFQKVVLKKKPLSTSTPLDKSKATITPSTGSGGHQPAKQELFTQMHTNEEAAANLTHKEIKKWGKLHKPRRRADLPSGKRARDRDDDPTNDEQAVAAVLRETHTVSAQRSTIARAKWWVERMRLRKQEPYPLTIPKLQLAAALLKRGRYRSASQYLYTIKQIHLRSGYEWPSSWDKCLADLRRSCARGIGEARQAAPLDLDKSKDGRGPYDHCKLARVEAAIHVGCGRLLREIEPANLKGNDLTLQPGSGCGKATVFIEASKTDTEARGCHRSLECCCPAPACPDRCAA